MFDLHLFVDGVKVNIECGVPSFACWTINFCLLNNKKYSNMLKTSESPLTETSLQSQVQNSEVYSGKLQNKTKQKTPESNVTY